MYRSAAFQEMSPAARLAPKPTPSSPTPAWPSPYSSSPPPPPPVCSTGPFHFLLFFSCAQARRNETFRIKHSRGVDEFGLSEGLFLKLFLEAIYAGFYGFYFFSLFYFFKFVGLIKVVPSDFAFIRHRLQTLHTYLKAQYNNC